MNGQFRARDSSHLEKRLRYVLEERMGGLQNRSGWLGERTRTCETTGNERRSLGSIDRSLVKMKDSFLIVRLKVNLIRKCINKSPKDLIMK
jgi:hypothetical protein